jgi:polyhydroxyalkanoate synthesis repressor PhaR
MDFVVVDKKTEAEITRCILLQVIAEQETDGDPMMSQDFLAQMIRSFGDTMQSLVGDDLEQSLKLLTAQQARIRDRVRSTGQQFFGRARKKKIDRLASELSVN